MVRRRQRLARRLDPFALEQLYQVNYLELARQTDWLRNPPLSSPGGGTASFSQLYLLLSILRDGDFHRALELGVGKSTGLIQQWASAHSAETVHVDDDADWLALTVKQQPGATAIHAPLAPQSVAGHEIDWYGVERPQGQFDLVLIDGPQAWTGDQKYNRLGALSWLPEALAPEFVLVIDDASRPGERRLATLAEQKLRMAGIDVQPRDVVGSNSQALLVTPKYRFAAYL